MTHTRSLLAALAAAASMFMLTAPATAAEVTPWPELMKAADANKDGMVSRKEFLDQMAKVWDEKHAAMMKSDATMKKDMMNGAQFSAFMKYFMNPGQIGGQ